MAAECLTAKWTITMELNNLKPAKVQRITINGSPQVRWADGGTATRGHKGTVAFGLLAQARLLEGADAAAASPPKFGFTN